MCYSLSCILLLPSFLKQKLNNRNYTMINLELVFLELVELYLNKFTSINAMSPP